MARFFKRSYIIMALLFVAGVFCVLPKVDKAQPSATEVHQVVSAEETVAMGKTWASEMSAVAETYSLTGYGTSFNPYKITSAEDLAYLAYAVNEEGNDFSGEYISLESNIDLSGKLWTPIGHSGEPGVAGKRFCGTFLGNCHTIRNIAINDASNVYSSYVGLFGYAAGAEIYDLKLDGYFYCDTAAIKGTLVGAIQGDAVVSNIRDNTTQPDGQEINTIGIAYTGVKIFKSGSFDGVTADLTTQDDIDNSVTVASGSPDIYYLSRYKISSEQIANGANFYYIDTGNAHNLTGQVIYDNGTEVGKVVNVPMTSSLVAAGLTDDEVLAYSSAAVKTRADATMGDFYVKCPGMQVTSFGTPSFTNGLLAEIVFAEAEDVSITIDLEYGTRPTITLTIPYDTSFAEVDSGVWTDNKVFDRLGYTLTYFTNDAKGDNTTVDVTAKSCYTKDDTDITTDSFPIDGASYYFPMDGTNNYPNEGHSWINFLIGDREGNGFATYDQVSSVVSDVKIYKESDYQEDEDNATSDGFSVGEIQSRGTGADAYPSRQLTYLSGNNYIEFTIAKGYELNTHYMYDTDPTFPEHYQEGVGVQLKGYSPSGTSAHGIFLNFANHTGTGTSYSIFGNNDDYANVAFDVLKETIDGIYTDYYYVVSDMNEGETTYRIRLNNHVGSNGEINVLINRKTTGIIIRPKDDNGQLLNTELKYSYVVQDFSSYDGGLEYYKFLENGHLAQADNMSSATLGSDYNIYMEAYYNKQFTYTFTAPEGYMISGVDKDCDWATATIADDKKSMTVTGTWGLQDGSYITPIVVPAKAKATVEYYYESDEDYTVSAESGNISNLSGDYSGLAINVNGSGALGINNTAVEIDVLSTGGSVVATNGDKYRVKEVRIYKQDGTLAGRSGTALAQNGATAEDTWSWGNVNYLEGAQEYTIKVLLEKVKYNVKITTINYGENTVDAAILESALFTTAPTINGTGKDIWVAYGDQYTISWQLNELGNKLLTFTSGASNETPVTMGTQSQDITLNFTSNTFTLDVTGAVDVNANAVADANVSFDEQTFTLIYDADTDNSSKLQIKEAVNTIEVLNPIMLSSAYYMSGWYVGMYKFDKISYHALLSRYLFLDYLANADLNEKFEVKAIVGARQIQLQYNPGAAGLGELLNSDKTTAATVQTDATLYKYSDLSGGFTLPTDKFYNIGYAQYNWEWKIGEDTQYPIIDNGVWKLYLNLNDFGTLFDREKSQSTERSSFDDNANYTKTLVLTANWGKLGYSVLIDEDRSASIALGAQINATFYDDGDSVVYTISIGTSSTGYNLQYRNHTVTGFKITGTEGVEGEFNLGQAYRFDVDFIKQYLKGAYFEHPASPIAITTIKERNLGNLHIAEESYSSVAWDEDQDDAGLGQDNAGSVEINVVFDDTFASLASALNNGALTVTRDFCTLKGFSYNGTQVVSYNGSAWVENETKYDALNDELVPIWELNDDLTGLVELNFNSAIGANNSIDYRLATAQDILEVISEHGEITTGVIKGLALNNFKYFVNGNVVSTGNLKFNTQSLTAEGSTTIRFTCDVTLGGTTKSIEQEVTINVVKNEFVFNYNDNALKTIYTGTSEIAGETWNSDIMFGIKYNWKSEEVNSYTYNLKDYLTAMSVAGSDFNVGTGKDLSATIGRSGIKYVGTEVNINVDDYSNFFESSTVVVDGAAQIIKANFKIRVNETFAYDEDATYYSSSNISSAFTSGSSDFNFTYDLVFNKTTSKTYTYAELDWAVDAIVSNVVVKDSSGNVVDDSNYNWGIDDSSTITISNASVIYINITEQLSYEYNGLVANRGSVTYDDAEGKYTVTVYNDLTYLASADAEVGYKEAGSIIPLSDGDRAGFISAISSKFNFAGFNSNVGEYSFTIDNFTLGTEYSVNIQGNSVVKVTPKTISVSGIEKPFDGTTAFDTNNVKHKVVLTGVVEGDEVVVTGAFADNSVGEDKDINISINNTNYILANAAVKGKITSGERKDFDSQSLSVDYGTIKTGATTNELETLFNAQFKIEGADVAHYVTINSITINDAEYSTGGYLKQGEYTVVYNILCAEYGYDNADVEIELEVNKIIAVIDVATGKTITKAYDGNDDLTCGVSEDINQVDGYFISTEILSGDKITITSGKYADETVAEGKIITLSIGGNDAGNYTILNPTVTGEIATATFTFKVVDDTATTKQDIVIGAYNPDDFHAGVVLNPGASAPTKTGYTFAGWENAGGALDAAKIKALIETTIAGGSYQTEINPVWSTDQLKLTINFEDVAVSVGGSTILSGDEIGCNYESEIEIVVTTSVGYDYSVETDGEFSATIESESHISKGGIIKISHVYADETITIRRIAKTYTVNLAVVAGEESVGRIQDGYTSQTVAFGGDVQLKQEIIENTYVLYRWADANGNEVAGANDATLRLNDAILALLEEAEANGNAFTIFADYDDTMTNITFKVTGRDSKYNGKVLVAQGVNENSIYNNVETVLPLVKGEEVAVDLDYLNAGYVLKKVSFRKANGDALTVSYTHNTTDNIILFVANGEIAKVLIEIKAVEHTITVQSGVVISGITKKPTTIGGEIYLADVEGNKNIVGGEDVGEFTVKVKTDETLYFVVEAKTDYLFSDIIVKATEGTVRKGNNNLGNGLVVYNVSGFISDGEIVAKFTADTQEVKVVMVSNATDFTAENAGVVVVREEPHVLANTNRQSSIQVTVIKGRGVTIQVKSRLGYTLFNQGTEDKVYYYVKLSSASQVSQYAIAGTEDAWETTGYSQMAEITLNNINENVTIYVLVTPNTYNVNFVDNVGKPGEILGSTTIMYNQMLAGLAAEVLKPVEPEDYYLFNGYWTSELSKGTQYIDANSKPEKVWSESGYYFDGEKYAVQGNYQPNTNTFTLYAGWTLKKAQITVEFEPAGSVKYSGNIRNIILNDDTDNVPENQKVQVWTYQGANLALYGEVYYGSVLEVSAPYFEGYSFVKIEVYKEDRLVKTYSNDVCTLDAFEHGEYTVKFVYYPKFTIEIQNPEGLASEGGSAWIEQGGRMVGDIEDGKINPLKGKFDYSKSITLKAKAKEGYDFIGWKVQVPGFDYDIKADAAGVVEIDGEYSYTLDSLNSETVIFAVFKGKSVEVVMSGYRQLLEVHGLEIKVNNRIIRRTDLTTYENKASFDACIGDEVKFIITKGKGYTFELSGIGFSYTINSYGQYEFTSKIALDAVTGDSDNYMFNVGFTVGKELITIKITSKTILDMANSNIADEISLVGDIFFVDAKGNKILLNGNQDVSFTYGDNVSIQFGESYYSVAKISLGNSQDNLAGYMVGNTLSLTTNILDKYYSKTIEISIAFERKTWSQTVSTTHVLQGRGTERSPYLITNAKDFAYVAYLVNNRKWIGGIYAVSAYYKVTNSIDFSGRYWEPIGTPDVPFKGEIDLGGYVLSNIMHYKEYSNPKTSCGGLIWGISDKADIVQTNSEWIVWTSIGGGVVVLACVAWIIASVRKRRKIRMSKYM